MYVINWKQVIWGEVMERIMELIQGKLAWLPSLQNPKVRRMLYKEEKLGRRILSALFKAFFLVGFSFVILYPVFFMISRTFMQRVDIYDNTVLLIPRHFTLDNLQAALMQLHYWPVFGSTVFLAVTATLLTLGSCLMAGYAMARFDFRLKNLFFVLVLLTIVVPPQLIQIPTYFNFRFFDIAGIISLIHGQKINLIDTYFPFWLLSVTGMGIRNGLFIYLFRQFFRNVPKEIEEAAEIDGAGSFKTFTRVMIPNAVTIIVTVTLFSLIWQYNDSIYSGTFFVNVKVFANSYERLERLDRSVTQFLGFSNNDNGLMLSMYLPILKSAGVLLMMLPLILMFLILQRFFVESVERSGIVG